MSIEPQEHDDLWNLLGKSKNPTLPPEFTRKVMASVAAIENANSESSQTKRPWQWITVGIGSAAALLFWLNTSPITTDAGAQDDAMLVAALKSHNLSSQDLALLANLDELIDAELSALWSDPL